MRVTQLIKAKDLAELEIKCPYNTILPSEFTLGLNVSPTNLAVDKRLIFLLKKMFMEGQSFQTSRRKFLETAGIFTIGAILFPRKAFTQTSKTSPVITIMDEVSKSPVKVTLLRDGIYLMEGSGGNIAILEGPEGKLMVDAGISVSAAKIKDALAGISHTPVKYLINTHWHFDHASGNEWIHGEGATIIAHPATKKHLANDTRVDDWNYTFKAAPDGALPTDLVGHSRVMKFNNETISVNHYPPAHTDGDLSVYFQHTDILHTGDTWWNGYYPFIDFNTGGSIHGMIAAANANVKRVTDKTIIIPGHGPAGNKTQLKAFADMLEDVTGKIERLKKQGKTLEETVAATPTAEYDSKWGNFVISGSFFTSLVYRSIS